MAKQVIHLEVEDFGDGRGPQLKWGIDGFGAYAEVHVLLHQFSGVLWEREAMEIAAATAEAQGISKPRVVPVRDARFPGVVRN